MIKFVRYIMRCCMLFPAMALMLLVFSGVSCGTDSTSGGEKCMPEENAGTGYGFDKTWTILVYMDGDNSLEQNLLDDINEMEKIDFAGRGVNVIILADRTGGNSSADGDWTGTRLYKINHDCSDTHVGSMRLADPTCLHLTDAGDNEELDMGDPDTLSKFIDFGKNNSPADLYGLIIWNHGNGWRAVNAVSGTIRSICQDDTNGSILYMSDLEQGIKGKGIDLMGFDACLMGMVEVAYQLHDPVVANGYPKYLVASEANEPASGWAYDKLFMQFLNGGVRSPENLGKAIIDTYFEDNAEYSGLTCALIDQSKMDALTAAVNAFANNLMGANADDICAARADTQSFNQHNIDLYDFAARMTSVAGAQGVIDALGNAVLYHKNSPGTVSHGFSIYFPLDSTLDPDYSEYDKVIRFSDASTWDEFLDDYYGRVTRYTIETFANAGGHGTDTYLSLFTGEFYPLASNDDIDPDSYNYYSKILFPLARGKTYYILCTSATYKNQGPYSINVSIGGNGSSAGNPSVGAYEPNNDTQNATVLPVNTVRDHQLENYGDDDWFKITIP